MGKWLMCAGSCGCIRWDHYFSSLLWTVVLLAVHQRLVGPVKGDSVPATTKFREVTSVSGSVGQIPCPILSFDDVVMILWFKGGSSGAPIYSYDARNEEVEARHLTLKDDWGLRLYFRVWPNNRRSPALMIQDLKPADSGVFRCRVDYRNSPTTNSLTRLKIIEPPTRLEIRDTSPSRPISDQQIIMAGKNKHSDPTVIYMGPYTEGQDLTLVCSAYGGKPLPEVRWYKNGDVVDTTYSLSGTEYTINEMTISNLGRNHSLDLYTCQANNNNETQALTHKVHLEIYLGVTSVELEIPSPMTAGTEYNIVCRTIGAYPTVKVEFWKNAKRIVSRSQMKSVADNVTITNLQYKPEVLDDGSTIICKAENPWVSKKPTVARKTMKIKYAPVAVLRLGRNRTTAFTEGESILMECHVKANPTAHTILWFHQGRQLSSGDNETAGIRIKDMTLFISYLNHQVGGDFNCEAVNDVGKGISNTLPIEVHLSPKCVTSEATRVPLAIGETQWLTCNILAWPSDLNFYWTLNRSDSPSGSGKIRSSRNLTEHHLPIASVVVARGTSTAIVTAINDGSQDVSNAAIPSGVAVNKTNSPTSTFHRKGEHPHQRNQSGNPVLLTSSSESLDYPEDQHVMSPVIKDASVSALGREFLEDQKITTRTKAKRSTGKDILLAENGAHYWKGISAEKEEHASVTHSTPHVSSTSSDPAYSNNNNSLNKSISLKLANPLDQSKLTGDIENVEEMSTTQAAVVDVVAEGDNKEDAGMKTKRHVYPSSTSSSFVDGKVRGDGGAYTGFQDKIRHTSRIPYQVKSEEDFGVLACYATNSFGSQVFPCLFHIIKKEDSTAGEVGSNKDPRKGITSSKTRGSNTTDKEHTATSRNLTAPFFPSGIRREKEILGGVSAPAPSESTAASSQRGFSKLQKTLGIVLLFILIFIAALSGLAFALLFVLAKRRREIRRIVIAHSPTASAGGGGSGRRSGVYTTFSSTRKCPSKTKTSKGGGGVANKNAPSENCEEKVRKDEIQVAVVAASSASSTCSGVTLPLRCCSSPDMFVVRTSGMNSFRGIARGDDDHHDQDDGDANKGKPQLSYISTDTTTATTAAENNIGTKAPAIFFIPNKYAPDSASPTFPSNNNNTADVDKDIEPLSPEAFKYLPNNNSNGCWVPPPPSENGNISLQLQFVDQEGSLGTTAQAGFKSMTPRAVELFGSGPCSTTNSTDSTTSISNNGGCGGNNNSFGEEQPSSSISSGDGSSSSYSNACANQVIAGSQTTNNHQNYSRLEEDCLPRTPNKCETVQVE